MDTVTVIMSTYNGEQYLAQQLDSLLNQTGVECHIFIRDDGSTDYTQNILNQYAQKNDNVQWISEENIGAARSFWKMMRMVDGGDYYAFCDQDDVWLPNKLSEAVEKIKKDDKQGPVLYYSQTIMVDKEGNLIKNKTSDYQLKIPSFSQLIMENTATGCTMVWNQKLHEMARELAPEHIRMHDHFLHLICSACNGYICYDQTGYVYYRQHEDNVIGGRNTLWKYIKSIGRFLHEDSGLAVQALELLHLDEKYIGETQKEVLETLQVYKNGSLKDRLSFMFQNDYNQASILKNIMIKGMILLHRV
jgi:glycosyltransferase involved in cell wall biosynthesis